MNPARFSSDVESMVFVLSTLLRPFVLITTTFVCAIDETVRQMIRNRIIDFMVITISASGKNIATPNTAHACTYQLSLFNKNSANASNSTARPLKGFNAANALSVS